MALFRCRGALAFALLGMLSCRFSPAGVGGNGGEADATGGGDGAADASGDAGCAATCSDAHTLVDCVGASVPCPLVCASAGEGALCLDVSNGADPATYLEAGLVGVLLDADYLFDAGTGRIAAGSAVLRDAGEGLDAGIGFHVLPGGAALFVMGSLEVASGRRIRFTGDRSIILLVEGDVVIRGLLDVSAASCAGVCGELDCGPGGRGNSGSGASGLETGGGGGALGQAGAPGGTARTTSGGVGGRIANCPGASLVPLQGGSGGGTGGEGGAGGQGGGALQITSLLSITVTGGLASTGIHAGGEGGSGGLLGGGGGGGSGGAILLEAPIVTLADATLAANGGGGGSGGALTAGENGRFDAQPATGGTDGASGGPGGALGVEALKGTDADNNTGGGGGGAGIIRINAGTFSRSGAVISPAPSGP